MDEIELTSFEPKSNKSGSANKMMILAPTSGQISSSEIKNLGKFKDVITEDPLLFNKSHKPKSEPKLSKSIKPSGTLIARIISALFAGLGIWLLLISVNQMRDIDNDRSKKCDRVNYPIELKPLWFAFAGIILFSCAAPAVFDVRLTVMSWIVCSIILIAFTLIFVFAGSTYSQKGALKVCQETAEKYSSPLYTVSLYSPAIIVVMSIIAIVGFYNRSK